MLDKLKEMTGGNQDRIKVYVSTYIDEMYNTCDILEKAIEENNLETIKYAAHISKPLTSMMGFDLLHIKSDNLEKDITDNKTDETLIPQAQDLLKNMKDSIEEIKSFV